MSCEEIQDDFVLYLLGELEPELARTIDMHLAGCERCREDFNTICSAVDQVFSCVPAIDTSLEEQAKIAKIALRRTAPPAKSRAQAFTAPQPLGDHRTLQPLQSTARFIQAILAVAAGFFLVLGWEFLQSRIRPPQYDRTVATDVASANASAALSGDPRLLPRAHQTVRFVSITAQPAQPEWVGSFLLDPFSGEAHIMGTIARAPQPFEQFQLIVTTNQAPIEVGLEVRADGRFKAVVPVAPASIRDVALVVSSGRF